MANQPGHSIADMQGLARELGADPHFDWEAPRTREGYYRIDGSGTSLAIARARVYAPSADLVWMETSKPTVAEAAEFAAGVKAVHPDQMLAYNLSPSFNWDAAGMSDAEMESFTGDLAAHGFVWQFITLAGLHSNGLISEQFASGFAKRGMHAYVNMIQRQEREHGVEMIKHQRWSGAELVDNQATIAVGGSSSTSSMSAGVTEGQFSKA